MRRAIIASLLSSLMVLGVAQAGPTPSTTTSIAPAHQARIDAAKKTYALLETEIAAGIGGRDELYAWSRHLYEAERDAGVKTAGADHLARMKKLQALTAVAYKGATISARQMAAVDYYVAEAELWK